MSLDFSAMQVVLLALSAGAALLHGAVFLRRPPSAGRSGLKTLPVAALAALAAAMGGPPLLIAGLALSALGDAALSRSGERAFMAGLGAFLAAHLAYIPLFWSAGGGLPEGWRLALAAALIVHAALFARWLWPHLGPMRAPVAAYVAALGLMAVAATTAPAALWPLPIGAALFVVSDSVLAAETFVFANRPRRWTAPAIWASYYAAQVLIAAAFLCPRFAP